MSFPKATATGFSVFPQAILVKVSLAIIKIEEKAEWVLSQSDIKIKKTAIFDLSLTAILELGCQGNHAAINPWNRRPDYGTTAGHSPIEPAALVHVFIVEYVHKHQDFYKSTSLEANCFAALLGCFLEWER